MVYQVNQPVATNKLSVSAPILQGNTNSANTAFGFDHNPFTATSQIGYHTKVTMQPRAHPSAVSGEAIMYAAQDSTNLGVLNYSLGSNSGPPTPLTYIQNAISITVTPTAQPIFDFNGLSFAVFNIFLVCSTSPDPRLIQTDTGYFTSSGTPRVLTRATSPEPVLFRYSLISSPGSYQLAIQLSTSSGSVSDVYYAIQFLRIS